MSHGTTKHCSAVCDELMVRQKDGHLWHSFICELVAHKAEQATSHGAPKADVGWRQKAWKAAGFSSQYSHGRAAKAVFQDPTGFACLRQHLRPRDDLAKERLEKYIDMLWIGATLDQTQFYSLDPKEDAIRKLVRMIYIGVYDEKAPRTTEVDILDASIKGSKRHIKHTYNRGWRPPTFEEVARQCAKAATEPLLPIEEIRRLGLGRYIERRERRRDGTVNLMTTVKSDRRMLARVCGWVDDKLTGRQMDAMITRTLDNLMDALPEVLRVVEDVPGVQEAWAKHVGEKAKTLPPERFRAIAEKPTGSAREVAAVVLEQALENKE